ncbi:cyclic nucleotide-binding protein [Nitzschia inconspicua]|uniref:Cyclic nucleotide-binding protein n=1 Tax=Nitzschia inconspicua TaxID=303405 RepID=A0A9K3KFG2_9STRA|nr:cyclic nucleotide-binding protein [Nitzschia inconspicua]
MTSAILSQTTMTRRMSFCWLVVLVLLLARCSFAEQEEETHSSGNSTEAAEEGNYHEEEIEPAEAVLYPSFILTLGIFIFYLLSRYLHFLPYTAIMFILGTLIGLGVSLGVRDSHIHRTVVDWQNINSEVLLLVFLPGLIFKDALGQNVHLFWTALGQMLIFAFPLVLAGTVLTALVGFYVFPYGWSFNMAMTFGSILSATDPVAVAALLEEVGAPPRLKTHIAGESLLNDGSAIVFFAIFSEKFYHELGIPGFGEDVDFAEGVKLFCQKAIGGTAFGVIFGLAILYVLYILDRRFSKEENVVQVTAVVSMAYLNYYVADFIAKTSGVIATVVAGLIVRFAARASINDIHLMDDFFVLLEHILNTILFSLGGLVWGGVIVENHRDGFWTGRDWGYLIALYILLHIFRAVMFLGIYPITKRTGLSTNLAETTFQVYGGLRGAVGIALALALDNEVYEVTGGNDFTEFEIWTTQAYQMVGGIAFLTLIINGTFAGPFLKKLGLADSSDIRAKLIEANRIHFRQKQIDDLVELLTLTRFYRLDFGLVKFHVPYLADLTLTQLVEAIEKLKDTTQHEKYRPPNVDRVVPYLVGPEGIPKDLEDRLNIALLRDKGSDPRRSQKIEERRRNRKVRRERRMSSTMQFMMGEPLSTKEMRLLFISMVRAQYEYQINDGELDSQHLLTVALEQSLEEAETDVMNDLPFNDYKYLRDFHFRSKKVVGWLKNCTCGLFVHHKSGKCHRVPMNQMLESAYVEQTMAYTSAHKRAQWFFQEQLGDLDSDLSEAGKIVIHESNQQIDIAQKDLNDKLDAEVVKKVVSHKFCKILLTRGVHYIDKLTSGGFLKESEAEEIVKELDDLLENVITCDQMHHEGELDLNLDDSVHFCSLLPQKIEESSPDGEREGIDSNEAVDVDSKFDVGTGNVSG